MMTSPQYLTSITRILGWTLVIGFALVQVLPFVFAISNSFKCISAVQAYPQSLLPVPPFGVECQQEEGEVKSTRANATQVTFNPTLDGYRDALDDDFIRWMTNTIFVASSVTILHLLFDTMAGYALARLNFPGNRLMFYIIWGMLMVPGIVLLLPRFILMKELHLLNSYASLVIPFAASGFGVFLMKQFYESLPRDIEEAALVDGASHIGVFARIILPMSNPALTALAIFTFQSTWNEFLQVLLLVGNRRDLWTLPLGLVNIRGAAGRTGIWNTFLAASITTALPLGLFFLVFQKYIMEGVGYTGSLLTWGWQARKAEK